MLCESIDRYKIRKSCIVSQKHDPVQTKSYQQDSTTPLNNRPSSTKQIIKPEEHNDFYENTANHNISSSANNASSRNESTMPDDEKTQKTAHIETAIDGTSISDKRKFEDDSKTKHMVKVEGKFSKLVD